MRGQVLSAIGAIVVGCAAGVILADCQTPADCEWDGIMAALDCMTNPAVPLDYLSCKSCCMSTAPESNEGNLRVEFARGCDIYCERFPVMPPGGFEP